MTKFNKSLSLVITITFLLQSRAYGTSEKNFALRPPSHFSKTTEEYIAKSGAEETGEGSHAELRNKLTSSKIEIINAALNELDRVTSADDVMRLIEGVFEDNGLTIDVEQEGWEIETLSQPVNLTAVYIKKGGKKAGVLRFYPDPLVSSQIIFHSTGFENDLRRRRYFTLLQRWVSANSSFSKYSGWKIKLDMSVSSGAAKAWWRSGFDINITEIGLNKNKVIKDISEIKDGKHYNITGTFLTWAKKYTPSLETLAKQRLKGENICLPIVAITAVLDLFNQSRRERQSKSYTIQDAEESSDKQIEIMKWLSRETGMPIIYWFMNLDDMPKAVLDANKIPFEISYGEIIGTTLTPTLFKSEGFSVDDIKAGNINKPGLSYPSLREQIEFIRKVKADPELKGKKVLAWVPGPATLAGKTMGEQKFSILSLDDPDTFNQWITYAAAAIEGFAEALAEAGADTICILEPSCALLSPDSFNSTNIIGETNRIIEAINKKGVPVVYHACGNTAPFLEEGEGFGRLNFQGISLDKQVPPEKIIAFYSGLNKNGRNVVIFGNSESINFYGLTIEGILKEGGDVINNRLRLIADDGMLIPTSSCEITRCNPNIGISQFRTLVSSFNPKTPPDIYTTQKSALRSGL